MSSMTNFDNPFSVPYLTEASLAPDELLARYSFRPFFHIQSQISRTTNVFLIGRKGVGKTMLLKIFEADLLSRLFESHSAEHEKVKSSVPTASVGVYLNFAAPGTKLKAFQGAAHSREWWQAAYGDFLNSILVVQAIDAVNQMLRVSTWRTRSGFAFDSLDSAPGLASTLLRLLADESSDFDGMTSLADVHEFFRDRSRRWIRFVNRDRSSDWKPQVLLSLGTPLFHLASAIRATGPRAFRFFVLVDQYEYLYHHRMVNDFRPVFNEAMYHASRGGTGVEFKVGTRHYAHSNLRLVTGDARIERDREMIEIDLDQLASKYYDAFVTELFVKRLHGSSRATVSPVQLKRLAADRLPSLSPMEEAELYIAASRQETRHLTAFLTRWKSMGVAGDDVDAVVGKTRLRQAHPLVGTLASIALTRWLREPDRVPVLCGATKPATTSLGDSFATYADELIICIEARYAKGIGRDATVEAVKVDHFVRDTEQVALFQLASAYKNQRKYYAGIDTIIRLSSNVALVFIEILRAAYESTILQGGSAQNDAVSVRTQSDAIYQVSESWFTRIPSECDFGTTMQNFLRSLGSVLRRLQLEISAPIPDANGFSVTGIGAAEESAGHKSPRDDARQLLLELVSWGLLEERTHQDKGKGRPKRKKLYVNRILCPYFGISERWHKDPIYVGDLEQFVSDLLDGSVPQDFKRALRRAASGVVESEPQEALFI